ncbi:MAG: hypothetical protein IJX02_06755 [Clostridia bacterium]|nr:hypothetical protein [Clostridia bacterium]
MHKPSFKMFFMVILLVLTASLTLCLGSCDEPQGAGSSTTESSNTDNSTVPSFKLPGFSGSYELPDDEF